jgi:hypothetical protein
MNFCIVKQNHTLLKFIKQYFKVDLFKTIKYNLNDFSTI